MNNSKNAWVHRLSPGGVDQLQAICLPNDLIVTGWSAAEKLEEVSDWYEMRERIKKACYPGDENYRRAGGGNGSMWKFLQQMKIGDYVVVPYYGGEFLVAEITGDPVADRSQSAKDGDAVYRRPVKWLNGKKGIPRNYVKSGLRSRMKIRQTTATAGEFIEDIESALKMAMGDSSIDTKSLFDSALREKLIETTLKEIKDGYMDERKFEGLIRTVMIGMGAKESQIIPRQHDNGIDVRSVFMIGPTEVVIGAQAKYYRDVAGAHVLHELIRGMETDGIDIGWLITSAELSADFEKTAEELTDGSNKQIHVIGGSDFAAMVVDYGMVSRL